MIRMGWDTTVIHHAPFGNVIPDRALFPCPMVSRIVMLVGRAQYIVDQKKLNTS